MTITTVIGICVLCVALGCIVFLLYLISDPTRKEREMEAIHYARTHDIKVTFHDSDLALEYLMWVIAKEKKEAKS